MRTAPAMPLRICFAALHPFTLNDMLACAVVLALLLCLSAPALVEIDKMSKKASCSGSLLGIAKANILYAKDYGCYVPASTGGRIRWHGTLPEDVCANIEFSGPLEPYFSRGDKPLPCPLFKDALRYPRQAPERGGLGYGYNEEIGSLRSVSEDIDFWSEACRASGVKPSQVESPSGTVMFAESGTRTETSGRPDPSGKPAEMSFCHSFDFVNRARPCWGTRDPTIDFRHRGSAAVAWVDGHISWEPMTFSKGKWQGTGLGFIGTPGKTMFSPKSLRKGD